MDTSFSVNVEYLFFLKCINNKSSHSFSVYVYIESAESGDDNYFSCKICGTVYRNKHSYTMHTLKDMVCGTDEMMQCVFCDSFQSRRKGDLKRHIDRKHSGKFKDKWC